MSVNIFMKYFTNKNLFSRLKNFVVKNKTFLILFCIFTIGAHLRFYNLNWDEGYNFHPDEKNIVASAARISLDDLNPHFSNYGGFSIYFYRFIGEIVYGVTGDQGWIMDWGKLNLIGRNVSATLSSMSIILVFFLSSAIFKEKKVALLASALTAFTVYLIQAAHYSVTDTLIIFWLLLLFIIAIKFLDKRDYKGYEKMGMFSGLALATKMSSLSFLLVPVAAHLYITIKDSLASYKAGCDSRSFCLACYLKSVLNFLKEQSGFIRFIFFTFVFFFLFSPFNLLDSKHFFEWWNYENGVVTGKLKLEIAYTYQFLKTTPYLFQIENLFWLQGPLLKVFSLLGFFYLSFLCIKKRDFKIFLLLIWPIAYFYIVGGWYAKFVRYMAPLLPFLAIFAAKFLIDIEKKRRLVGRALIVITLASVLLYSISFLSIYKKESTRIVASKWIYENIPSNSKVLTEWSDDQLPIYLKDRLPIVLNIEQLNVYGSDNTGKINYYAEKLSGADYIVIASRRMSGTFSKLPDLFPVTAEYYQLLFKDKMGYDLIKEFHSYPKIFGYEINDETSEETFQVFDHPKIFIFKNNKKMTANDYKQIFGSKVP